MNSNKRLIDTEKRPSKTWREVLNESAPLLLPAAHDALTASVIELAGYPAKVRSATERGIKRTP
jgi:2-methylisocitrate lyase-like PEP mutase family enzyme